MTDTPTTNYDALYLRPVFRDDLPLLYAWRQDIDTMQYLPTALEQELTWERHAAFWEQTLTPSLDIPDPDVYRMVILQRRPVGVVHMKADGEVGVIIGERDLWGKGVATEALTQFLRFLSGYGPRKGKPLHAVIHPKNAASLKLFQRLGFTTAGEVGRNGQVIYRRTL